MEEKNRDKPESLSIDLFKWRMGEKELQNQVENYNTLGLFQSARKISGALLVFSAILTLIFIILEWSTEEAFLDIFLLLILAFFVYKGKKMAIIIAMVYWTIAKVIQIIDDPGSIIMSLIWWTVFMSVFWKAHQVEKAREISLEKKRGNEKKEPLISSYCPDCETKVEENANFCRKCGREVK